MSKPDKHNKHVSTILVKRKPVLGCELGLSRYLDLKTFKPVKEYCIEAKDA